VAALCENRQSQLGPNLLEEVHSASTPADAIENGVVRLCMQEETTMDFGNEQRSRGTMKGFVMPALFVAGWVAAASILAIEVGPLRTDIQEVLSRTFPLEQVKDALDYVHAGRSAAKVMITVP
jgi:hypothetical protein